MKIKGVLDPEGLRTIQQLQFRTGGHSLEMKKKRKRYISKAKESELRNRGTGRERDLPRGWCIFISSWSVMRKQATMGA